MADPSSSPAPKIPTKILCISDTVTTLEDRWVLPDNLPACDVLVHTGNMTQNGLPVEYEKLFRQVKDIKADLKLFIAGLNDIALDEGFYFGHHGRLDSNSARETHGSDYGEDMPAKVRQLMIGPAAQAAGITYLDEGMHEFVLRNGAKLHVYASPWTPKPMSFGWRDARRWAFRYMPDTNRFDPPELITPGMLFAKQAGWDTKAEAAPKNPNPIPNGAKVDLVMTHGPPYSHLDPVKGGKGEGCPHLLVAVERASPRLHAFGRTLEGWGAEIVKWKGRPPGQPWSDAERTEGSGLVGQVRMPIASLDSGIRASDILGAGSGAGYIDITSTGGGSLGHRETLLVNACLDSVKKRPNPGWLVNLDLDPANADDPADEAVPTGEGDTTAGSKPNAEMTT